MALEQKACSVSESPIQPPGQVRFQTGVEVPEPISNASDGLYNVGVVWRVGGIDITSKSTHRVDPGSTVLAESTVDASVIVNAVGPGVHEVASSVVALNEMSLPAGNELHCQDVMVLQQGQSACDIMECPTGTQCVDGECVSAGGNGGGGSGGLALLVLAGVAAVALGRKGK